MKEIKSRYDRIVKCLVEQGLPSARATGVTDCWMHLYEDDHINGLKIDLKDFRQTEAEIKLFSRLLDKIYPNYVDKLEELKGFNDEFLTRLKSGMSRGRLSKVSFYLGDSEEEFTFTSFKVLGKFTYMIESFKQAVDANFVSPPSHIHHKRVAVLKVYEDIRQAFERAEVKIGDTKLKELCSEILSALGIFPEVKGKTNVKKILAARMEKYLKYREEYKSLIEYL